MGKSVNGTTGDGLTGPASPSAVPAGLPDWPAVGRSRRDSALNAALDRLAPDWLQDRPDTPDGHVTAVGACRRPKRSPLPFPPTSTSGSVACSAAAA